jgi:hypothetical protein
MEQNPTDPRMDRGFVPIVRPEFALASPHMAFNEVFSIFLCNAGVNLAPAYIKNMSNTRHQTG